MDIKRYLRSVKNFKKRVQMRRQLQAYSKRQSQYDRELTFNEAANSYPNPNALYSYMHHYFNYRCPQIIRDHRMYFKRDQRGFGEDAFHAMWYLLLLEYKPVRMLEIGVYRGQIITLWSLIGKYLGNYNEVHGISPFTPLGDSVSAYRGNIDYFVDVRESFEYWKLQEPVLIKSLSTDKEAVSHIESQIWDLIYIDGSHDYSITLADYKVCSAHLRKGGLLILDDASLESQFCPPPFSFAGHPGPSKVAREHADKEQQFLCSVGHNNIYLKL